MTNQADDRSHTRRVLMIVGTLPLPFDWRAWFEAITLHAAGYIVFIILPKDHASEPAEEVIDGIYVYRHPLPTNTYGILGCFIKSSVALFWQLFLSIKIFFSHGFDVVHICNPPDLFVLVGMLYKVFGRKKFVFDHRELGPELFEVKFGRRGFFHRLLLASERLSFRTADISIAANESFRQIANDRGGMQPGKIFVVRSGPLRDRAKPTIDPRWRNDRRFMVAYAGEINQVDGLDLLLVSIEHIVRTRHRSDIHFVIAGSGPEWRTIAQLCGKMGLGEFVTFTGQVDESTLLAVISNADLCVAPDRVTATRNIVTTDKIMEYMALGKSIVQFEMTEGRFSAQNASLYALPNDAVDFGEKILALIDDPLRRQWMGEFGQRRVYESLAWQHEQLNLLKAYDALSPLHTNKT